VKVLREGHVGKIRYFMLRSAIALFSHQRRGTNDRTYNSSNSKLSGFKEQVILVIFRRSAKSSFEVWAFALYQLAQRTK